MHEHDGSSSAGIASDARDVCGYRETREVRSVRRRLYARVTGGPVWRVQAVVRHYGHLARGAVATGAAFLGGLDEWIGGCALGRMGGGGEHGRGHLPRGRNVPTRLVEQEHINQKETYGLYRLLRQFRTRHPDVLRGVQMLIDVDNQSVVDAFYRERARNRETHALLVQVV